VQSEAGSAQLVESLLAEVGSVAYARFTRDGVLSGANARFRGLIAGRRAP